MTIKMRTEAEAWLEIARVFAQAIKLHPTRIAAYQGICRQAMDADRVSRELAWAIAQRALPKEWKNHGRGPRFRWPRTVEGARKRIAFCRRQIRRLDGVR